MVNDGISTGFRQCPTCGSRFNGRSDKRYCSEQCRTSFNLQRRKRTEAPLTAVLATLRRNRSILKDLCPQKKTWVSRDRLEALKFNPTVFSSIYRNNRNQSYYFCGDYGFLPMHREGIDVALIIRREPFAKALDPWKAEIKTPNT